MVDLRPGEAVVKEGNVVRQNPQGPRPGVLTLTNHRLIFEVHLPQGPGGPVVRRTIDAPLGRIQNVAALDGSRLQVQLPMQVGVFESPEAAEWVRVITEARSHAPPGGGMPGGPRGPGGPGGPGAAGRPGGLFGQYGPRGQGGPGPGRGPGAAPPPPRPCAYCGRMNEPAATKCAGCSAPLPAG